jgi:DNA-binding PadR family transcriptional regulator
MKVLTRQEEQILLAIYHLGKNAYLVPIREQIKKFTGKYFSVGTIFAPLNRLDIDGYLESYMGESNSIRGGKAIKYYKITDKGYQALSEIKKFHERMWEGFVLPDFKKEIIK